ncbi:MAG: sodium-dependent transporter [Tissierellia bacterium]|nr:sodium-dependent transporter [Tissierellia bacterium]
MENKEQDRGQFASNWGFIMAAAGSAVGLGNLWKFPYLAGQSGGGVFVITYLFLVVAIGYTMMLGEMAIGRATKLDPYSAYRSISPKWGWVGGLGILTAFVILSYYSVVGGWVIKYIISSVMGTIPDFGTFIGGAAEPIIYHAIFMLVTILIVLGGISGGIEKASKIMMPALFVALIIIVIRSVTLPGAGAGLEYYLKPDFSKFSFGVVLAAMGQVFFSLSLGMGALVTYGSYLDKSSDLEKNAFIVPAMDTSVALLAGFAILPAVFAFGKEPGAGPSLLFITLPEVFAAMPFGRLFAVMFFVLVLFAALTSSISLLEVVVSFTIDKLKMSRKSGTWTVGFIMFIIGIFASLSNGPILGNIKAPLINMNIFDTLGFFTDKLFMPIGGLAMCLFIKFAWGVDNAVAEIKTGDGATFKTEKLWRVLIGVVAPIMIAIILVTGLWEIFAQG